MKYNSDSVPSLITGMKSVLIDYYVAATDILGNTKKTDIFHVYVRSGNATCNYS